MSVVNMGHVLTDYKFSNRHVTSKFKRIPTLQQWMTAFDSVSNTDDMVITRGIMEYHAANGAFQKAFVLKELYKAIDRYLARRHTPWAPTGRVALVDDLYKCVVLELCEFFQAPVNMLPIKLSQVFQVEQPGVQHPNEQTLTIAQREECRLIFEGGAIKRYSPTRRSIVLAETQHNPELGMHGLRSDSPQAVEGDAGYVMAPWDGIYMARHDDNHFHSQYLDHQRVVCAGDIVIRGGKLTRVSNNSGHYIPPATQLIPLLWCFQKNGVNMGTVQVVVIEDMDHCYMCLARRSCEPGVVVGRRMLPATNKPIRMAAVGGSCPDG